MFATHKRPATIDPAAAARLLQNGQCLFVDVREMGEWAQGHIPGAHHAPLSNFEREVVRLPRDKAVVVYCLSGARSARALATMVEHGIANVHNLAGGISIWRAHGLPTV